MDLATSESQYIVNKAKTATDPATAKAWILTAKKLYAQNFGVQFEAYRLEKIANNSEEAAKCFSYIIQTFQNQPADLWHEIAQLTAALRIPEGATTTEQEFYVKMFQHISYEVQHKILLLTANHSDNNLEHCRLILLLLKRFPQAIHTHSPRLLETLIQGITANQPTFRDMLVLEALPLLMFKPPDLPMALVNRIMAIVFEYYINQMLSNNKPDTSAIVVVAAAAAASSPPTECGGQTATSLCMTAGGGDAIADCWRKIFETLELCGRILKWEPYLGYNRDWSKDVYWQKLIQIVSTSPPRPAEHKQILFCATILFVHALQEYVHNVRPQKIDDTEVEYILVEQFNDAGANSGAASAAADLTTQRRKTDASMDAVPHISVVRPCTAETPICFVTAAQCWQLLHANELLQADFSKLLRSVPLSSWINRFLIDLAIYLGRSDEAHNLLKDSQTHGVEKHLRMMSLSMAQSTFNVSLQCACLYTMQRATRMLTCGFFFLSPQIQTFDLLMKILVDMPTVTGQWVNNRNAMGAPSTMSRRQLILLPVTKRAVLQYCTRIVVNALKVSAAIGYIEKDCRGMWMIIVKVEREEGRERRVDRERKV